MREQMRVKSLDEKVSILSPRNTLNRGYSLTVINGHAVTDASQLKPGDEIISHFKNGSIHSTVK
jgi:exodeoxyribonuclease VII large subunit